MALIATTSCQRRTSTAPCDAAFGFGRPRGPRGLAAQQPSTSVDPIANVSAISLSSPSITAGLRSSLPHCPRGDRSAKADLKVFVGTDACHPSAYTAPAARPRSASANPIALLVPPGCQSSAYSSLAPRQPSVLANLRALVVITACQRSTSTAPTAPQLSSSADSTALVAPLFNSLLLLRAELLGNIRLRSAPLLVCQL